jgi:hypothetical protein
MITHVAHAGRLGMVGDIALYLRSVGDSAGTASTSTYEGNRRAVPTGRCQHALYVRFR